MSEDEWKARCVAFDQQFKKAMRRAIKRGKENPLIGVYVDKNPRLTRHVFVASSGYRSSAEWASSHGEITRQQVW